MSSKGKMSLKTNKKLKLNNKKVKPVEKGSNVEQAELKRKITKNDEMKKPSEDKSAEQNSSEEETGKEESSEEESGSEHEIGDELDLDQVSSEDDESHSSEEDEEFPKKKKSKNSKHDDGSSGFSTAVNAILSSHLKAYDRKDPIMARNKKVLKQNESQKLEQKAKRELLAEKKKLLNKARKKDIIPTASVDTDNGEEIRNVLEKERKLRKIAQKGVVKLFNAILSTQVKTDKEASEKLGSVRNRTERKELITEVSKEKFLDLVKAAGDS